MTDHPVPRLVAQHRQARHRADALEQENAELRALVADLADPDPCHLDHHGYCQAHGWFTTDPACPAARARAITTTPRTAPRARGRLWSENEDPDHDHQFHYFGPHSGSRCISCNAPETAVEEKTCCHLHRAGRCCDPEDCGPCCERCPSCPTLARRRTVESTSARSLPVVGGRYDSRNGGESVTVTHLWTLENGQTVVRFEWAGEGEHSSALPPASFNRAYRPAAQ